MTMNGVSEPVTAQRVASARLHCSVCESPRARGPWRRVSLSDAETGEVLDLITLCAQCQGDAGFLAPSGKALEF